MSIMINFLYGKHDTFITGLLTIPGAGLQQHKLVPCTQAGKAHYFPFPAWLKLKVCNFVAHFKFLMFTVQHFLHLRVIYIK